MGVEVEIKEVGDGKTFPKSGDKLKMHYTGTLKADGSKFDSSRDRGKLFEFTIGVGQVIKGWDEGVIQMSVGEISTLNITADFGYGAAGAGADIPPNADLVFDVELVAINGKKYFYTAEEKELFKTKMAEWKESQLAKYDAKESFKAKKDEKHGDKESFEKFLTEKVDSDVDAVKTRPVAE
jgi:FK506-binding protein 1